MSDYFHIVSALCRQIVKEGASPAALTQIERLQQAMKSDERKKEANLLSRLIKKANEDSALIPSKVQLSRASVLNGQILTPNTKAPSDKESGAPLCEVLLPGQFECSEMPVLDDDLERAVEGLISEWNNLPELEKIGVAPALTSLIFGAPGTGKTKLAHYIASRLELPLVVARLDGLVSSFLGTSARNITNLFDFASRYKCILLLDEFDAVAKARDDKQEVGEIKRIVNTLLQCLDSRSNDGITIAITNHETLLDPAVWRRFSARVFVPRPNNMSRRKILENYLPPLKIQDVEMDFLVWMTDGYTGSDLENMSNTLKRYSIIHAKHEDDFIESIKAFLLVSSTHDTNNARSMVLGSEEDLANALHNYGMSQKNLAVLFNKHPSTISRWFAELRNKA